MNTRHIQKRVLRLAVSKAITELDAAVSAGEQLARCENDTIVFDSPVAGQKMEKKLILILVSWNKIWRSK
ncbi:hypothetical protein JTE90_009877 [Oedothorax gibbosus]|uniref:Uncharacterized protein n=1 Tax=Oedothorax gibbosus TaxID=931172 RepID=A0AAV6UVZ4_9ARAC|nr:hypothetical protein JTE90_009877 [Oedothorax gibbosus]